MTDEKKDPAPSAIDGGLHQSVARIDIVLDALATNPEQGLRLTDVCNATGLGKTAVHRMLNGLVAHRLADYDEHSSRYFIGFKIFSWASGAGNRFGLLRMAEAGMARLADHFEDAVYLLVRHRHEAICIDRVEGAYPIKTLALRVGDRRPLGVGAGSLAMLSSLDDREVESILSATSSERAAYRLGTADLQNLVGDTRRQGYALVEGRIVPGIATVGVPILLNDGRPIAAISVSAIQERMPPDRRSEIVVALKKEVATISAQFGSLLTAGNARNLVRSALS